VKFDIVLDLPDPLGRELLKASRECCIPPSFFVAESVESVLASRRLPNIQEAPHGARLCTADLDTEDAA